nr:RNA-directed DNA polymerase, eukaryota [Tanacetum cinerariifolium]
MQQIHHQSLDNLNSSFIALIVKKQDAKLVKEFRPISLIENFYKIIAKILANRLIFVLGDIVNEAQAAFVVNRQILDGPFIRNKLIHWCKSKKKQTITFKVDYEKAYYSVWRFRNDGSSSWARVIKAMHGVDGRIGKSTKSYHPSAWVDIVNEVNKLKSQGLDLLSLMKKKVETNKMITVDAKLAHENLGCSLHHFSRDEAEMMQYSELMVNVNGIQLSMMQDRWPCSLKGSRNFSVASVRKYIDDYKLTGSSSATRWVKAVPIKINVMAWKVRLNALPTRLNLSYRGLDLQSILCLNCDKEVESTSHIFFGYSMVRDLSHKIASWWDICYSEFPSYEEWLVWLLNLRIHSHYKEVRIVLNFIKSAKSRANSTQERKQVSKPDQEARFSRINTHEAQICQRSKV